MLRHCNEEDYRNISELLDDSTRAIINDEIGEEYSHDELGSLRMAPEVVVKAMSTEEVSRVLAYANCEHIPVTPRGAGTGLVGAAVPALGGIVLDLSEMNRILELDQDNLTVTVEPGVLLMTLAAYTEENDFLYPPDPGEKTATIGGNISTNAGGMRAVKYGVTRDYVRELEVVLADGTIITLGGKVVKNSSGLALKELFVGAEGTLGIVTKATLRLLPLPKVNVSLLVPFRNLKDAIDAVPKIIRSKAIPTAIEFMSREVIMASETYLGTRFPDSSADAYLLLKFDGNSKTEVEADYSKVAETCISLGAIDAFIMDTEERSAAVWKARGAFLEAIKNSTSEMDEVDVVVPRSAVNEMVTYTDGLQEKLGVRIRYFGHAGDGNLHIYILRDALSEQKWKEKLNEAMRLMYKKAGELRGQVSGEHGIGHAKMTYLEESLGETQLNLMRGIKKVFDPNGILNPMKDYQ